jgi:hypothetical protein
LLGRFELKGRRRDGWVRRDNGASLVCPRITVGSAKGSEAGESVAKR